MKEPFPPKCVLVADDLTGACDTVVHFAARSLSSRVQVELPETALQLCGVEVLALNTQSRYDSPEDCRQKIRTVRRLCSGYRSAILFKKIDSTFRGNIGIEIAQMLESFEYDCALIAPAFPAMGRVVRKGVLHWSDCAGHSGVDMLPVLRGNGLAGVEFLSHSEYSSDTRDLSSALKRKLATGVRSILLDCETQADLLQIVGAGVLLDKRVLWVGSAGLGIALAALADGPFAPRHPVSSIAGSIVFCIGSTHPATARQISTLAKSSGAADLAAASGNVSIALQEIRSHRPLILRVEREAATESSLRQFFKALTGEPIAALLMTGGNTAALLCRALGAKSLRIQNEIACGLPWGVLGGGMFNGLPAVTKSGGFGEPDAFLRVTEFFAPAVHKTTRKR